MRGRTQFGRHRNLATSTKWDTRDVGRARATLLGVVDLSEKIWIAFKLNAVLEFRAIEAFQRGDDQKFSEPTWCFRQALIGIGEA